MPFDTFIAYLDVVCVKYLFTFFFFADLLLACPAIILLFIGLFLYIQDISPLLSIYIYITGIFSKMEKWFVFLFFIMLYHIIE